MSPAPIAQSSFQYAVQGVTEIMNGEGSAQAVGSAAKVGAGLGGVAFSWTAPVMNIINTAMNFAAQAGSNIPAIKQMASDMNLDPAYGQQVTNVLTTLQDLGGTAMAILGAKGGGDLTPQEQLMKDPAIIQQVKDVVNAHNALSPETQAAVASHVDNIAKPTSDSGAPQPQVTSPAETPASNSITMTPAEKQAAYAKSQGYEPITPDNQLPTIDMGAKPKSDLPTIQTEAPKTPDLPGYKVVPEPTATVAPKEAAPAATETPVAKPTEAPAATIDRPVLPDGTRVTKAANDINENLVKQGLSELPKDQMAKYTTGSYKDSATQADILAKTDRNALNQMATTGKNIPEGVHPQILFNAVEALATKEGDTPLLQELAKSPLATQLSEAGGTMGSHGFNDNPNSAVKAIRALQDARESVLKKRGGTIQKDAVARIKDSIRKTNTPKTWSDFVASLEC
jgi:hypothetical protein